MDAAISGLEAHQTMLDVTANNLANVDTIGYKAQRTTFVDELAESLSPSTAPTSFNGGINARQVGLGVAVGSVDNMMGQGSLQTTGNALDIAIEGNGFFEVATGDPTTTTPAQNQSTFQYTRAGNFQLNSQGYLMSQSGQYVVGQSPTNGGVSPCKPTGTEAWIKVPTNATNVAVGQDGAVTYTDQTTGNATYGQTVTAGYVELSTFPNNAGLVRDGGSMWSASQTSGTAQPATPGSNGAGTIMSGSLEMSNVDLAGEFSNMITAERGYQANSKVITTADNMLQSVVNMPQG